MNVNKWFLSMPPERQAVLIEDKWMLANAAAQAAAEEERERIASEWDCCFYEEPGGAVDIGAIIRGERSN